MQDMCLVESQDICLVETQDMCCVEKTCALFRANTKEGVNAAVEALINKTQIFNLEAHPEKMSLTVFYVFCYVFNKQILKCQIV